jgi:hypothetical protein
VVSVTVPDGVAESVVTVRVRELELPRIVVVTGCLSSPQATTNGRTAAARKARWVRRTDMVFLLAVRPQGALG